MIRDVLFGAFDSSEMFGVTDSTLLEADQRFVQSQSRCGHAMTGLCRCLDLCCTAS